MGKAVPWSFISGHLVSESLDLCGGLSRMQELRRQELLLNQEG